MLAGHVPATALVVVVRSRHRHAPTVREHWLSRGQVRIECRCAWSSKAHNKVEDARREYDRHVAVAERAAKKAHG